MNTHPTKHARKGFVPDWDRYLERTADGDHEALVALYDETCQLVYSLALRMLGDTADAEAVTLDVYTQVWRDAKTFDPRQGTVAAWLVMLTRTRAIDRLRTRPLRSQDKEPLEALPEIQAGVQSPEPMGGSSQQQHLVRAALDALPPEQRDVIELAFFSGFSPPEIATMLGQPLGTVKTLIRLGMMTLREQLGMEDEST